VTDAREKNKTRVGSRHFLNHTTCTKIEVNNLTYVRVCRVFRVERKYFNKIVVFVKIKLTFTSRG